MKRLIVLTLAATMLLMPLSVVFAQTGRPDVSRGQAPVATAEQHRHMAAQRVEEIKQRVAERRAQVRQDVCERRQANMNRVMPRLATNATALKTAMDTLYQRVQGFYESGQLTVANYEELKANVDAAQTEAAAAVAVAEDFEFELDCDNPNVSEQLDGFRLAVTEARQALKGYRTALVELISAMRAEAAEHSNEADANHQDSEGEE